MDMDFEIDYSEPEKSKSRSLKKLSNVKKQHLVKIKYHKIICDRASGFKDIVGKNLIKGVQYRIVTNMSFNAITVIEYLLEFYKINELYIAVFRMNNKAFDYLKEIIINDKIKATFLISVFFANNKKYEKWSDELVNLAKKNKTVHVGFGNIHAKVFLAKTTCNKYIVFEGSGNLSHNEAIEQYIYENNKEVYNFHKNWIDLEIAQ